MPSGPSCCMKNRFANEGCKKIQPDCASELEKKLDEMRKERELQDTKLWTPTEPPTGPPTGPNKIKKECAK